MGQCKIMAWKAAARAALHNMGGLVALRLINRRKFRVLAFHSFSDASRSNVEAICAHITAHFEPLSLPHVVDAVRRGVELPDNALAITVDDGYKNYALYGHPIFRRHRIPITLFAVAGFAAGRLWLWPDQIEFGLEHTLKASIPVKLANDEPVELPLTPPQRKAESISRLTEMLKTVPNQQRLAFMAGFARLCDVEIPPVPPLHRAAMNWDDLRAAAADGVDIGCHTESHPILTRLESQWELEREIKGAKRSLEEGLGLPVRHFCYPNGKTPDIDDNVVARVQEAGFDSAVTCLWGLNSTTAEPLRIQRLPFDSALEFGYAVELLAGLHV
jgi:peptidoglycan/xylan/chitin deacetylase (PgdA/CDA1 family)